MYLNATIHVPSNIKMHDLNKKVPIHVHIPSEKKDFITIIKAFPEIIIMPSVVVFVVLILKGYHYYHFYMDKKTMSTRIYLLEHKVFPCPYKRKLHHPEKFDHELTFMWNHYMEEDRIYRTLLRAKEYRKLLKEHTDVFYNLRYFHYLPVYNSATDEELFPELLSWKDFCRRKTHAQILVKYAFQTALKDKFSIFRLDRNDDIIFSIEPEKFVGAFWDRKTSSYVVIGQPDWWEKSIYAPTDDHFTFLEYKVLDEDYRRTFIPDDECYFYTQKNNK